MPFVFFGSTSIHWLFFVFPPDPFATLCFPAPTMSTSFTASLRSVDAHFAFKADELSFRIHLNTPPVLTAYSHQPYSFYSYPFIELYH
ncbi:hypothetical protein J3A83DRAFT_3704568 [Scleroderma citrinum]